MGNDSILTRGCWRMVDRLSQLLEPWERESVLGDLVESGASGEEALLDLLGLVIRRQAGSWNEWWFWLGLAGMVVPLGLVVGQTTVGLGGGLAAYYFYRAPLEAGLAYASMLLVAQGVASGFVVGSLSRRTIWTNATVFYLMWLAELALGWHPFMAGFPLAMFGYYGMAGYFFRTALLPLALVPQLLLFVLPSLWGMRRGLRFGAPRTRPTPALAAASVIQLVFLVLVSLLMMRLLSALNAPEQGHLPHWQVWLCIQGQTILMLWPLLWPLAYMAGRITLRESAQPGYNSK
jgi:hypothetical protein